jgi:hypothetical protein
MRNRRWVMGTMLAAATVLGSLPCAAQPASADAASRATARALGEEGNDLFDRGDFAGALDRYQRAAALVDVPPLAVQIARCQAKLGRLIAASETYLAVTRKVLPADALPVHREAQAEAERERAALTPRIPGVVVKLRGAAPEDVQATLDGAPFAAALFGVRHLVDPGEHRVEVSSRGRRATRAFAAAEAETVEVDLDLDAGEKVAPPPAPPTLPPEEPPPASGSWQMPVGLVVAGVGVAGLGVGAVFTALAASDRSNLEEACGAELACGPASWDDVDAYNTKRIVSSVGLIAGGALTATGVVLVIWGATSSSEARTGGAPALSVALAPERVILGGTFR